MRVRAVGGFFVGRGVGALRGVARVGVRVLLGVGGFFFALFRV